MSSNRAPLARFLDRLLLRSTLGSEEREAVLALPGYVSQVAAHRDIVFPGRKVDHACLVVDGLTARFDQMKDGRRQITALHIPGDMCDLHSVTANVAGWGITAVSTATVLHIPHAALLEMAARFPAVGLAFWGDTVADGSVLAKWVSNLGRRDARARLSHLLCEMGVRMQVAGLGQRDNYPFPATQEQIADALGLTPVHVNRMLGPLREQGVATLRRGEVHIGDWPALVSIAEFDPAYLLYRTGDLCASSPRPRPFSPENPPSRRSSGAPGCQRGV
jgi:CRP-like cAMP-binding protein